MLTIEEELDALGEDADVVVQAIKDLDREIFNRVQTYELQNGSHVRTHVLDELSSQQKKRVVPNFIGHYYERTATCTQYRVAWDAQESSLVLIESQLSQKHICIPH